MSKARVNVTVGILLIAVIAAASAFCFFQRRLHGQRVA